MSAPTPQQAIPVANSNNNNSPANQPANQSPEQSVPRAGLDVAGSFVFMLEQRGWPRILIQLIGLGLIPGLNLMTWGGSAQTVARQIARGEIGGRLIWRHWSDMIVRGLIPLGSYWLHALPAVVFLLILAIVGDRGGVITTVRAILTPLCLLYMLVLLFALNAGHVRSARMDRFAPYSNLFSILGDCFRDPGSYGVLITVQAASTLVAGLLLLLLYYLIIVSANLILDYGALVLLAALPIIGLIMIFSLAVVSLCYLACGHLIGQIARRQVIG